MNFLSGGKLTASYLTKNEYIYEPIGSASYSIPQLSGLYALGLQVNPQLKYSDFVDACKKNALVNKAGLKIINPLPTLMDLK